MKAVDKIQGTSRRGFMMAAGSAAASGLAASGPTKEPFRGVFTIPSTPFRKDGEIDVPSFRRLIDFCVACGAHGLVFPVNASEWTALSDEERFKLSQVLAERNAGRVPVVIGVTASTEENAARFAAQARTIGADAVMAMPPHGGSGDPPAGVIFNYYRRISEAGRLPVFVQTQPAPTPTKGRPHVRSGMNATALASMSCCFARVLEKRELQAFESPRLKSKPVLRGWLYSKPTACTSDTGVSWRKV